MFDLGLSDNSNVIEYELQRVSIERQVKFSNKYAFITCPFHNDHNPSTIVNTRDSRYPIGFFHCFSCGISGDWNKLAEKLFLNPIDLNNQPQQKSINLTKLVLEEPSISSYRSEDIPGINWDTRTPWRGIDGNLLSKIKSKLVFNFKSSRQELYLPCFQLDKLVGSITASLEKSTKGASYINSTGVWTKKSLFPFDYTKNLVKELNKTYSKVPLFIVEGPRDALNLLQNNIPALALLGCTSWCSDLISLLYVCNASEYIVLMDGDLAGKGACLRIKKDLEKSILKYKYSVLELPNGKDPADMVTDQIHWLKSKYFSPLIT